MDKTFINKARNLIGCFHYSTDLPVTLFIDNTLCFKFPENLVTARTILKQKETENPYFESNFQFVENKYNELYIHVKVENNAFVIIGPVLEKPIEAGTVTNMIRNEIIPFHQRTIMQDHYHNCKIISKDKLLFSAKLLESLFIDNSKKNISEIEETIQKDEKEKYQQTKQEYRKSSFIHSPYLIEQEISKTISNGDTKNAKLILKEMNSMPHAKLASNTLRSYKNSMICSCAFMTRAAIAGGVNADNAFTLSDTYINQIENIETMEELINFESKMVEGFSQRVRDIKNESYSRSVLDAIYYIDDHLCENIKIEQIAKSVYLNPSYLSTLFHKETGLTLNQWIRKRRIEEAAYYVKNSNEDITSIAFFYQFCSQSYFVQCFKKVMGVTPGEYRIK